jgi:hypothetical protein
MRVLFPKKFEITAVNLRRSDGIVDNYRDRNQIFSYGGVLVRNKMLAKSLMKEAEFSSVTTNLCLYECWD